MKALTEKSVKNYYKLLKNIIDIPLLEILLDIGIDLIELHPEEQFIHYLVEEIQEKHPLDDIDAFNMKLRQVQDFYNDCIASYENIDMYEPEEEKLSDTEKVLQILLSFQSHDANVQIVKSCLVEAVETVAYEFGFMDELYDMDDVVFRKFLKKDVFDVEGGLYINYISMLDMRNTLIANDCEDERELYVMALMLMINLSVYNMVRIERFELEQKMESKKVGRNEPCPCGSGKKYKKCCGK